MSSEYIHSNIINIRLSYSAAHEPWNQALVQADDQRRCVELPANGYRELVYVHIDHLNNLVTYYFRDTDIEVAAQGTPGITGNDIGDFSDQVTI